MARVFQPLPAGKRRATAGWTLVVALSCSTAAHAGVDCSISSLGLNFGTYDQVIAQPDDIAGTVTVTCNYIAPGGATGVNYTVTIGNGLLGTSPSTRRMAAGSSQLSYNVFQDAARSQVWGIGTTVATGAMTVGPGVGNGTRTATHTVYGRVPALQDVVPGTYFDSLQLTLTY